MSSVDERVHRGIPAKLVDVIGQRIISGEWSAATTFRIIDVQEEFNVSATVAREVVLALQSKGLVESRPKRGVTVLDRSAWNLLDPDVLSWDVTGRGRVIADLEQARLLIEPWAAAEAADVGDTVAIARCRAAMTAMAEAAVAGDVAAITAADLEFHRALLAASGNAVIARIGLVIEPVLRRRDELTISTASSVSSGFLALHENVIAAVERRDGEAAESASRTLVQTSASDSQIVTASLDGRKSR